MYVFELIDIYELADPSLVNTLHLEKYVYSCSSMNQCVVSIDNSYQNYVDRYKVINIDNIFCKYVKL